MSNWTADEQTDYQDLWDEPLKLYTNYPKSLALYAFDRLENYLFIFAAHMPDDDFRNETVDKISRQAEMLLEDPRTAFMSKQLQDFIDELPPLKKLSFEEFELYVKARTRCCAPFIYLYQKPE